LSQRMRPVTWQPLAIISLVCSAILFTNVVDSDDSPALGLSGAILQFLSSRIFSGVP
jgi:hypothetical protein